MRPRLLWGLAIVALAAGPAIASKPSAKPRIDPFHVRLDGDHVITSFHVANAVADETLDRIRSGIPVRHRHKVEVVVPRTMWMSKVLVRLRVDTTAVYDALTRRFELSRTIRTGPAGKKKWADVREESHTTESVEEVLDWMSVFEPLPDLQLPAGSTRKRLRVRVESTLDRRFVFYLFPARLTVTAERRLDG